MKQLKTKKFVKGDRWEVCAICLDDYVDGAKLRILPCDHGKSSIDHLQIFISLSLSSAYHMKCIDPWLLNSRRQCPVCKRYVFPDQDHSDEENRQQQATRTSDEHTPLLQSTENSTEIDESRTRSLNGKINR